MTDIKIEFDDMQANDIDNEDNEENKENDNEEKDVKDIKINVDSKKDSISREKVKMKQKNIEKKAVEKKGAIEKEEKVEERVVPWVQIVRVESLWDRNTCEASFQLILKNLHLPQRTDKQVQVYSYQTHTYHQYIYCLILKK